MTRVELPFKVYFQNVHAAAQTGVNNVTKKSPYITQKEAQLRSAEHDVRTQRAMIEMAQRKLENLERLESEARDARIAAEAAYK